jgi:hypothetical protein
MRADQVQRRQAPQRDADVVEIGHERADHAG